jgi:hypothetical protein
MMEQPETHKKDASFFLGVLMGFHSSATVIGFCVCRCCCRVYTSFTNSFSKKRTNIYIGRWKDMNAAAAT